MKRRRSEKKKETEETDVVPKKKKSQHEQLRDVVLVFASAWKERLGSQSPVQMVAENPFLFRELVEYLRLPSIQKIFVCGGSEETGGVSRSVEIYTLQDDSWERGPDMITCRVGHRIARIADCIFAFGGFTNREITNSVEALDVKRNEWMKMPSMSTTRSHPGVGVVDDRIFVIGGYDGHNFLSTCEMFNVGTNKWETITPMTTKRYYMGVAVIGDRIIVVGGCSGGRDVRTVEALDTKTNTWTTLPPIPTARSGMAVGVIDDRFIWTFGGFYDNVKLDVVEIYDVEKNEWIKSSSKMTSPRFSAGAVVVDHKISIVGGSTAMPGMEIFDVDTMTWEKSPSMFSPREYYEAIGF